MTKELVTRLIELIHISYDRKWTEDEANEYIDLSQRFENWTSMNSKLYNDLRDLIKPHLIPGEIVTTNIIWKKIRKPYSVTASVFRAEMKKLYEAGKAEKLNNHKWLIK